MNKTKRLLKILFKDYPAGLTAIFICIITAACIGALPPVFIKEVTSIIMEGLSSDFASVRPELVHTITLMVSVYLVALLCSTLQGQIMARLSQGFLHKMRTRMFSKMQTLPVSYFDSRNDGDIMSYYTNDIDTLRQLISQSIPSLFSATLTITVLLFVMLYYSLTLMIIVLLGILVMIKTTKKIGGTSAKYFVKQQRSVAAVEGYIEEMMHGQKVVKVFSHEKKASEDFARLNNELYENASIANKYGNVFGPVMLNIGNLLYVFIAFAGGLMVCSDGFIPNISFENLLTSGSMLGVLSVPVIASYLGIVKQFTGNVNQVSQQINSIAMAVAGASRIFEILDEESEQDDGDVTLVKTEEHPAKWAWDFHDEKTGEDTLVPLRGDVRFENVSFAYEKDKPVLHNVSLYAKPGQKIAFVGATGAGKTTITNLINRFYDIHEGSITYDGIDIERIKKDDLRRSLGIVLQDVDLFTGTVMENIRYGRLDATDQECIDAAVLANADSFIRRLPNGYDTMLSGAGESLSQGQRQLLSIARAAVCDPPVMILDEATSSIDTRTELLVQKGMDALMKGRTVFVIAHRLSTVKNSDAIMVLDHGRIIERGSHEELIKQKGTYYELYTGAFELD